MAVIKYSVNFIPLLAWVIASMFVLHQANASEDNIAQLQKQLIELRSTVDAKSEELSLLRQESKQKRKFLLSQVSELEASIEDRNLVKSKIDLKLKENRALIAKSENFASLEEDLLKAIQSLSLYVSQSLPFKVSERLAALDEIKNQLISQSVSAPRLANKLWAFVEDELMLTKGNGIYRQIIHVDNEDKLVDVARVGMLMLYYRDGSNNVGMANRAGETWKFSTLKVESQVHQINHLFDAFQKQIRFGEFVLPNGLASVSMKSDR